MIFTWFFKHVSWWFNKSDLNFRKWRKNVIWSVRWCFLGYVEGGLTMFLMWDLSWWIGFRGSLQEKLSFTSEIWYLFCRFSLENRGWIGYEYIICIPRPSKYQKNIVKVPNLFFVGVSLADLQTIKRAIKVNPHRNQLSYHKSTINPMTSRWHPQFFLESSSHLYMSHGFRGEHLVGCNQLSCFRVSFPERKLMQHV